MMTTIGRTPAVEVTVPASYRPPDAVMVDVAAAIKQHTRVTQALQLSPGLFRTAPAHSAVRVRRPPTDRPAELQGVHGDLLTAAPSPSDLRPARSARAVGSPWRAAHSRTTSSTMCPSWSADASSGMPAARQMSMRCMNGSRVRIVSRRNPIVQDSFSPATSCGSGRVRFRTSAGVRRRARAAFGPTTRIASTTSAVVSPAFLSTCTAVSASMLKPPSCFCRLAAARCWRTISGSEAAICAIPSMWPAIARTSHAGQSVGAVHCSGVSSCQQRGDLVVLRRRQAMARSTVQHGLARRRLGGLVDGHDASSELSGGRPRLSASMSTTRSSKATPPVSARVVGELCVDEPADHRGAEVEVLLAS